MAGDGIPVYGGAGRGRTGWTESGQDRMNPGSPDGLDGSYHIAKVRVAGSNLVVRSRIRRSAHCSDQRFWFRTVVHLLADSGGGSIGIQLVSTTAP